MNSLKSNKLFIFLLISLSAVFGTLKWIYRPLPFYTCILYADQIERSEYHFLEAPFSKIDTTKGVFKYFPIPPHFEKKRFEEGLSEYKKMKAAGNGLKKPSIDSLNTFFSKNSLDINPPFTERAKYPILWLRGKIDSLGFFSYSEISYETYIDSIYGTNVKDDFLEMINSKEFKEIKHFSASFDGKRINSPYHLFILWKKEFPKLN